MGRLKSTKKCTKLSNLLRYCALFDIIQLCITENQPNFEINTILERIHLKNLELLTLFATFVFI